ncbi:hypothetical protein MTR67_021073, partial [Solanum verrucosum]
ALIGPVPVFTLLELHLKRLLIAPSKRKRLLKKIEEEDHGHGNAKIIVSVDPLFSEDSSRLQVI